MFCSVVAKDFPNALGKFTPCFTNIAILGGAVALMGVVESLQFCLLTLQSL